jgi:glycosyltransferase involved in cell wall biosynthesis
MMEVAMSTTRLRLRSHEIATHYTTFDKRIKVIAAPHTGRVEALRDAIAQTTGKYLAWVDSDDLLAPSALEETLTILEREPNIGMVYTDHLVTDERGKVKGLGDRCRIPYSSERLLIDFMTFHFRLMRRDLYDLVGGINVELESAEDYDLCLRFSEVTQIYHLPKPLYLYRVHEQSISGSQQLKQILASTQAVNDAIVRRGLSDCAPRSARGDRFELKVNFNPRFFLSQKVNFLSAQA